MSGRIRTVKPELFQHDGLHAVEKETGLPIIRAFIGLWTQSDREGRFVWNPTRLKLNITPYDDLDFADVLAALHKHGYISKYQVANQTYGVVDKFHVHQVINNREQPSKIPPKDEGSILPHDVGNLDASVTRDPRVDHAGSDAAQGEGKGREGKGTEGKGKEGNLPNSAPPVDQMHWLGELWNEHSGPVLPKIKKTNAHMKNITLRVKEEPTKEYWIGVIQRMAKSDFLTGKSNAHFVASFSWMISKGKDQTLNHVKVSDGNYDNRSKGGQPPGSLDQFAGLEER